MTGIQFNHAAGSFVRRKAAQQTETTKETPKETTPTKPEEQKTTGTLKFNLNASSFKKTTTKKTDDSYLPSHLSTKQQEKQAVEEKPK